MAVIVGFIWTIDCGKVMSRAKPKLTIKQLTQNMEVMTSRIDQFLNMFVQELEKHNTQTQLTSC